VELGIGTDEAWILERVGIRERRTVLPLDYIRQTRTATRRRPMRQVSTGSRDGGGRGKDGPRPGRPQADDIGMVISGCCAPNIRRRLRPRRWRRNWDRCPCLDVNSACTTFGMQIDLLDG